MANIVGVGNMVNEIVKELTRYSNMVTEEVESSKDVVSKELVTTLKQNSPKETGDYAKSWRRTKKGNRYIIHVEAPNYRLTHLLEKGHAKTGGGRVAPRVHIKPAEQKAIDNYLELVERAIRG